jgi:hypothetical protein
MAGADEVKTVPVSEDAAAVIKEAAVEADATPAADASTSTEA